MDALASTHKLRLRSPTYDGSYATFEEWKYKFSAYMGLQDSIFPQLLSRAERATTVLTDAELLGAATTLEEGEKWTQLCNNLTRFTYAYYEGFLEWYRKIDGL